MKKSANNAPVRGGAELRDLLKFAKELGFTAETTNGTKIAFRRPDTKVVFAKYFAHCRLSTRKNLVNAVKEAEKKKREQV